MSKHPIPQPGFMLIQGNRLEHLADVMTAWLREHPLAALENEVILVQSNGIGQWLKLSLAGAPDSGSGAGGGLGIAAAIELLLPARFIWRVYQAILGDLPDTSAFDKAPLTWRLYGLLGQLDDLACTEEESAWLDAPRAFLSGDQDPRRRYQLAERIADLFDQYQVYRADWLAAWARGDNCLILPDGAQRPVPRQHLWQPLLWRQLRRARAQTAQPDGAEASRAELHQRLLQQAGRLNHGQRPDALPPRVIVFGVSSLPCQAIEVLHAISRVSQVMLFVHNPCEHYWGDIVEGRELFRTRYQRNPERKAPEALADEELHLHGHPLLAAWGKQGRDYIRLLDQFDQRADYESAFTAEHLAIDLFDSPGQDSLLHQLQDDILALRPLAERVALNAAIDPSEDRGLSFLVAHSPQREVEILHDQLLDAFTRAEADGAPLTPRSVLVMVPAIETYAPHIQAVFGRLAPNDPRFIPFSLTDQGPRQRSPLLIGLEWLLNLPHARCTLTEILDLLDIPALRARFELDASDLPKLRQWIEGASVRWGLDAIHRQRSFGLPEALHQNTWQFGLERMLLGAASGAAGPWQGIEPYDEVAGLDAALVGQLTELLTQLSDTWRLLRDSRPPADWSQTIARVLDAFFVARDDADEQAISQVRDALEQWTLDCARGGLTNEPLPLEVVREPLLASLDEPNLSRRFLAGAVNFATLMPMRAVPFRQIWLLGMNDGDYPRIRHAADFNLMATDYRPGDRSRREDDRYLFLEALLSARERLTISWVGRGIRDNSERPPSVLVGQLRDHIAAGWRLASDGQQVNSRQSGKNLLKALTTEHPLQPFSPGYFAPGRSPRLFTYAHEWEALDQPPRSAEEPPPRLTPPEFDAPVTLIDLGRFLRHPPQSFYRVRLGAFLNDDPNQPDDQEPFDLDGLGQWSLRDIVIRDIESALARQPGAGQSALDLAIARRARDGSLPLPPFDLAWRETLRDELAEPLERYRTLMQEYPIPAPIERIAVAVTGLRLEDNPGAIRLNDAGERLRPRLQASRLLEGKALKWHSLIRLWPEHLAAQCQGPTRTLLLAPDREIELPPLDWTEASGHLSTLLEAYRQGLSEPLPLACKTGFAALEAAADPHGGHNPAKVYDGDKRHPGESADHDGYSRFWPTFARLSQDGRFDQWSEKLYSPLFNHVNNLNQGS